MHDDVLDLVFAFLILLSVAWAFYSFVADATEPPKPPKCEDALSACDRDVEKLKEQVVILKDDVKFWKKEAGKSDSLFNCTTAIALGAGAGALGGAAADGKTGLAPGGIVGLAVGLATCLIVK